MPFGHKFAQGTVLQWWVGKTLGGRGMLGWVELDRGQVHEFARILMPGIAALGLMVLLLTAS